MRRSIITISTMMCVVICLIGSIQQLQSASKKLEENVSEPESENMNFENDWDGEMDVVDESAGNSESSSEENIVRDWYVRVDIRKIESVTDTCWSIVDAEKVRSVFELFQDIYDNSEDNKVWDDERNESVESVQYQVVFTGKAGTETVFELSEGTLRNREDVKDAVLSEEQFRVLEQMIESLK